MTHASKHSGTILILGCEATMASMAGSPVEWLSSAGYHVESRADLRPRDPDAPPLVAACVNLALEQTLGVDVVAVLKERDAELPIIVFAGRVDLRRAATAMRRGAFDCVTTPLDRERLLVAVERASEHRALLVNLQRLSSALRQESALLNLRDLEKRAIERALERTNGNLSEAARLLGIGRATIYRKLAAYDIHAPS